MLLLVIFSLTNTNNSNKRGIRYFHSINQPEVGKEIIKKQTIIRNLSLVKYSLFSMLTDMLKDCYLLLC